MDIARGVPPSTDSMMRHPSAEDLDAAHQLVSSARGAREQVADFGSTENLLRPEGNELSSRNDGEAMQGGTSPSRDQMAVSGDETRSNASHQSPKSRGKDQTFLGHSCVYVNPNTSMASGVCY